MVNAPCRVVALSVERGGAICPVAAFSVLLGRLILGDEHYNGGTGSGAFGTTYQASLLTSRGILLLIYLTSIADCAGFSDGTTRQLFPVVVGEFGSFFAQVRCMQCFNFGSVGDATFTVDPVSLSIQCSGRRNLTHSI